ncbi:MAG: hypothetical protein IJK53_08245 [Erysipelotrichaceae bacterium]|nr:hypothetical protein [Erysipelotrichaceae bacterium]
MNKKAVKAFKRELENYNFYKINLQGTLKLIEYNEYLLQNVHGVNPQKEPSHSSGVKQWPETDTYYRIRTELDRLEQRRDLRIRQISYIESILSGLDPETKELIDRIYLLGFGYDFVARSNHVSKTALFNRIERKLAKML